MRVFQVAFTFTFTAIILNVIDTLMMGGPFNVAGALWSFATLCLLYFAVREDDL